MKHTEDVVILRTVKRGRGNIIALFTVLFSYNTYFRFQHEQCTDSCWKEKPDGNDMTQEMFFFQQFFFVFTHL